MPLKSSIGFIDSVWRGTCVFDPRDYSFCNPCASAIRYSSSV